MLPLPPNAQEILLNALTFMDALYDDQAGLLWQPDDAARSPWPSPGSRHMVRDSVYYALGLLLRDALGDRARAERVLSTVLDMQIIKPEAPFHGTFLRAPEEPRPGMWAREWRDYDPNWRDFIGCTFALLLIHFENLLPRDMLLRMDETLRQAVIGTLERRVSPAYTNIALMDAYLLYYAGERLDIPAWMGEGEKLAQRVFDLFKENRAFEEYNSPTYYGTDLFALGLWRSFSRSTLLRRLGSEMEAALWEDVGRFYHAGLRNACGPFDRSYGMDMAKYAALLGEWIWLAVGRQNAPFPNPQRSFDHSADFCFGPVIALVGAVVPAGVKASLLSFVEERLVERTITSTPRRAAAAWLSKQIMMGGECSGQKVNGSAQYHPFTLHYQAPNGETGWVRLLHSAGADAAIQPGQARIESRGTLLLSVCAPGASTADFEQNRWRLGSFTVEVQANTAGFEINDRKDGMFDLIYTQQDEVENRIILTIL